MLKIDNEFILSNNNFIYSIINKYITNENKDDLYQVSIIGLLKAKEKYNPNQNVKFSTFSYKYILGEVLKYLRENKNIKPSKDYIKLYKKMMKLKEYFYITKGKNISNSELSKLLNISEVKLNEIESSCYKIESLNSSIGSGDLTLQDIIEKEEKIDKTDLIELKNALTKLDKDEKEYIYERYYQNKTQTEIAKENEINQVKVYRYERGVLDKLKSEMKM